MAPLSKGLLLDVLIVCALFSGKTHTQQEPLMHFESVFNFTVGLRDSFDTLQDYVTKLQVVFCPTQPICYNAGLEKRQRILNDLPQSVTIGTRAIKIQTIADLLGICCLPCTCLDTCSETGYCCMSKVLNREITETTTSLIHAAESENGTGFIDGKGDTILKEMNISLIDTDATRKPRRSDCVIPSVQHYDRQNNGNGKNLIGFFMITRCFDESFNSSIVQKCEQPNIDVLGETVPVTSPRTKLTYWNQYCALCNNDNNEALHWNSTGLFGPNLVFFTNNSDVPDYPQTIDELQKLLTWRGDIIYSPPFPMEEKRCINFMRESWRRPWGFQKRNITWLLEACEQFTSPILKAEKYGRGYKPVPYPNLLCIFLLENEKDLDENAECSLGADDQRLTTREITGVIDYKPNIDAEPTVDRRQEDENGNCPCSQIYDIHLDECRPVFCPQGEFMVGCQCKDFVKKLSGITVLLYLKVVTKSGQSPSMTPIQIRKYNEALSKTLDNLMDGITSEIIATFKQETDAGEGYLSLALARSTPGHDTRQTMKPLLKYLDRKHKLEMKRGQAVFSVRLTSRIRQWVELTDDAGQVYKMTDLDFEGDDHFPLVYSDEGLLEKSYKQYSFQVFTPLLYCRQVLLNKNEFVEQAGNLLINNTSGPSKISIPYYYRTDPFRARVCVGHYLRKPKNTGAQFGSKCYFILMCNSSFVGLFLLHLRYI